MKAAVRRADIGNPATCHTLRHSFATHLLKRRCHIRTVQELLGHRDVRTTMVYTHVLQRGGLGVQSRAYAIEEALLCASRPRPQVWNRSWCVRSRPGYDVPIFKQMSRRTTNAIIVEREMTEAEFARMKAGFDEYAIEHGNPKERAERFGFVAVDGERFVGCSSGLAYKKVTGYGNWFFITDLFVEKTFRRKGVGAELLRKLEERAVALGIGNIWTWTAGYEAPGFYQKQGYQVFCEMDNWYSSGHSRVGLRKALVP